MSSSETSSSEEDTPRPLEGDFSFFDFDNEQKDNQRRVRDKHTGSQSDSDDANNKLHGSGRQESKGQGVEASKKENPMEKKEYPVHTNSKKNLMVHVPHDTTYGVQSSSDTDSSESVTDVSPLSSPDVTPRNFTEKTVTKANSPEKAQNNKRERILVKKSAHHKSGGDALSVEDLFYSSESSHLSSDERVLEAQKKKKIQRKKKSRFDEVHQRTEASAEKHRRRMLDTAAENSMDISQLLEVVLEMDRENQIRKSQNQRSGLLPPPMKPSRKKNMSFSNEQALKIDRENKRLLQRLSQLNSRAQRPSSASSTRSSASSLRSNASTSRNSRRPFSSASVRSPPNPGPRLYHSATNRLRDQQRIERENMALLKRLQMTKSSSTLRRENLLRDYQRQTGNSFDLNSRQSSQRRPRHGYSRYDDVAMHERCRKSKPVWQDSW